MLSIIMSVLLFLLKLIGIILLLILALILILLLAPIRYQIEGSAHKEEAIYGSAGISWLLSIVRFRVSYVEKKLCYELKIFYFTMISNNPDYLKKKQEKKEQKKERKEEQNKKKEKAVSSKSDISSDAENVTQEESFNEEAIPSNVLSEENVNPDEENAKEDPETVTVSQEETISETTGESNEETKGNDIVSIEDSQATSDSSPEEVEAEKTVSEESSNLSSDDTKTEEKNKKKNKQKKNRQKKNKKKTRKQEKNTTDDKEKPSRIEQIKGKIEEGKSFCNEYQIMELIRIGKKALKRTLRHVFPKRIEGFLHYGFEDPSLTGRILGYAAVFYPLYGKTFHLQPDFQESCIEGDLKARGRVQLGFFLWILITLILKKEVRKIIRFLLK